MKKTLFFATVFVILLFVAICTNASDENLQKTVYSNESALFSIDTITLRDAAYNELSDIPSFSFHAEATVTNIAYDSSSTILIATYDGNDKLQEVRYINGTVQKGNSFTFGTSFNNISGNVTTIKAFAVSDLNTLSALCPAYVITNNSENNNNQKPSIEDSTIKELEIINSKLTSLEENAIKYYETNSFHHDGTNRISAFLLGTGWSGDLENGFSHSGNEGVIEFPISDANDGELYYLTFKATGNNGHNLFANIGGNYEYDVYNGKTIFNYVLPVIGDNSTLTIKASNNAKINVTNISLYKVVEESENEVTVDVFAVSKELPSDNKTGFWNINMGLGALENSKIVTRSIAIGREALNDLLTGNRNIAIGTCSLPVATEANHNVAIGADSMFAVQKADECVAVGKASMQRGKYLKHCIALGNAALSGTSDSESEHCIGIGYYAGYYNNGKANVYIGKNAGYFGTTANGNVAVGSSALQTNKTGYFLTAIGGNADVTGKNFHNSTMIGAGAKATKSNQVVIGNSSVEEYVFGNKIINFNPDGTVTWENIETN